METSFLPVTGDPIDERFVRKYAASRAKVGRLPCPLRGFWQTRAACYMVSSHAHRLNTCGKGETLLSTSTSTSTSIQNNRARERLDRLCPEAARRIDHRPAQVWQGSCVLISDDGISVYTCRPQEILGTNISPRSPRSPHQEGNERGWVRSQAGRQAGNRIVPACVFRIRFDSIRFDPGV